MAQRIDTAIENLAEAFSDGLLCPALGAGVSRDLGVPMWSGLVERLVKACCAVRPGFNVMDAWEPIHAFDLADQDPRAPRALRDILYSSRRQRPLDESGGPEPRLDRLSDYKTPAVHYLAVLSILIAFSRERREFHVLSYNVDTFLEEAIAQLGHRAVAVVQTGLGGFKRILWEPRLDKRPAVWSRGFRQFGKRMTVRIFHPHGVILREEKAQELMRKEGVGEEKRDSYIELGLVFGRRHYNELFGSLDEPRNRPQLAAFAHLRCLFYGLSFTDPNVDRLLEMAWILRKQASPDRERVAPLHVRLANLRADTHPGRLAPEIWCQVEMDLREERRLSFGLGVNTLFLQEPERSKSFPRHKRFVRLLIRRIIDNAVRDDRGKVFAYPGMPNPPERRPMLASRLKGP